MLYNLQIMLTHIIASNLLYITSVVMCTQVTEKFQCGVADLFVQPCT